jgi:hypothetical protein
VQQINALTAAARAVSVQVLEDHLPGRVQDTIKQDRRDEAIKGMVTVQGKARRRWDQRANRPCSTPLITILLPRRPGMTRPPRQDTTG